MSFLNFKKPPKSVELNPSEITAQIQQHLNQLHTKMVQSLDMYLVNLEETSKFAHNLKWAALENMPQLLENFEENWKNTQQNTPNTNKILWANTAAEAEQFIKEILKQKNPQTALNFAGTEIIELGLNELLQKNKITQIWANWEHQLMYFLNEELHHPIFPLIHRNAHFLNKAFEETKERNKKPLNFWIAEHKANIADLNPKNTIAFMPAHFLCPDLGAVVWLDNEMLYAQAIQNADTIVVFAGIDRIVTSSNQIDTLANMSGALSNGEFLPYNLHYLMGNIRSNQELILIVIDNARTELLKDTRWRNLLCDLDGICWLNQCHDYPYLKPENFHPNHFGPISALLSLLFYENEDFTNNHTFWADTQDGFLPHYLNLDFANLLIQLRQELFEKNKEKTESIHDFWQQHQELKNDSLGIKKWKLRRKLQAILGKQKTLPPMSNTTFMQEWQDQILLAKKP